MPAPITMPGMDAAAVILAAGSSTRFGSPKQLAGVGGRTMLAAVAAVAHDAGLHPVIAVVPPGIAVPADVVPVLNDAPTAGLSRSLRLGLSAVPPECDAAMVLLGDQPTLRAATVRAVLAAGHGDRPIVAAVAGGVAAPPVLVRRESFALADGAAGDEGLRTIIERHPDLVTRVEVGQHAADVDTPGDLEALAR